MNTAQLWKKRMQYLSWGLYAAAAVLMAATVTRVSGHAVSTHRIADALEQCKTRNKNDQQQAKELLARSKEAGNRLKKRNVFVPPPPRPNPPTCQGIIGSSALFGDKLYKAGEKVGAAEILSVGTTQVVIKWEDREMTLVPFESGSSSSGGSRQATADARPQRSEAPAGRVPTPPAGASSTQVSAGQPAQGPRGAGMNMSPEERQQLVDRFRNMSPEERDRFREEQRQRFGERGGLGAGPRGGRGR